MKLAPLTQSLPQIIEQLESFLSLLEQETLALKTLDPQQLTELAQQKNTLTTELEQDLQQLEQQIAPETFKTLLSHPQIPAQQKTELQKLEQLSEQCHKQNLANGITIQSLSNLNLGLLQLFKGQDAQSKVYGAKGKTYQTSGPKSPLGTA